MTMQSRRFNNLGSLAFVGGLGLAAAFALFSETNMAMIKARDFLEPMQSAGLVAQPARGITEEDLAAARVAWRYFEANVRPETGLVDSVSGFASTTLWDQGSHLLALVSANGIDLIDDAQFHERVSAMLSALEEIPLFDGRLPNKVYDTTTLQMVTYDNTPSPDGIGWSALDLGRMLMAFRVLEMKHPETGPRVRALLARWDLAAMADQGRLYGAAREGEEIRYLQEGRIGYEQYGARAAALWGLDVLEASSARTILNWTEVSDVDVPVDIRRAQDFGAITPTLSEPYLLQAFELGLNSESALLASRIYEAQEARFERTGAITMVSEDHIDQAPHFLYGSVFSNGQPWAVVSEAGEQFDELRAVSLKAAFGWDALFGTEYSQAARSHMAGLEGPDGWAAGRYESDGRANTIVTLNTNAVVLEAVHYIAKGPLAGH
ncbi:DUF3131 domain-containing protein [Shimia haliotis]|uniref:DUF3131 domain-containing protein n=1 Tax=Shimia haliotis TaxID=1280847 RepID=A0A1I4FNL2_9RHOB|nr:DUF3131 domain-containing protein [Shimia haliotis]SFL19492.1 Protein of unknown function [Shimia haliotis]